MTNPYYEAGSVNPLSRARSAIVNSEFDKIELAFDSLHTSLNDFGTATSTTSILLGTGPKNLTIIGGHFIQVGQSVTISSAAMPVTHYMIGIVTAFDKNTGAATVEVGSFEGTGTLSNWYVAISPRGTATSILTLTGVQTISSIKAGLDITDVTSAGFNAKAPLNSPALTGTPTSPSATRQTDTTQIASTAYVQDNIRWSQISSANASGVNAITFSSIPTHYKELKIVGQPIGSNSASSFVGFDISTDGVTFASGPGAAISQTLVDTSVVTFLDCRSGQGSYVGGVGPPGGGNQGYASAGSFVGGFVSTGGISAIRAKLTNGAHLFLSGSLFYLYGR